MAEPRVASATTYTWNGGGGNVNWSTSGNWTGGVPTNNAATDLIFAGTTNIGSSGAPLLQNIVATLTIDSITFNSGAGTFFLGGSNSIQFNENATGIVQSSSNAQSIANPIKLDNKENFALSGTGAGVVTLSGIISENSSSGANKGSLTKSGTGAYLLTGNNTYSGGSSINDGTLIVGHANALGTAGTISVASGAILAVDSGTTFTRTVTLNSGAILAGIGTYTPGGTLNLASGRHVVPGVNSIGTLSIGNSTTFNGGSFLDIEFSGSSADSLLVTGTLDTTAANTLALSGTATGGFYTLATATSLSIGSHTSANGGFASVTGLDSANYRLNTTSTAIQMIHKATIGTITATPAASAVITGGTTTFGFTVQNSAPSSSDSLAPTYAVGSNVTGSASSGSITANSTSSAINGFTFSSSGAGMGAARTGNFTVTDSNATNSPQTGTVTVDVYDHASGSVVGGTTLNFADVIVGYGSPVASSNTVTINNASGFRSNLKTTNNGPQSSLSLTNISALAPNSNNTLSGSLATGKGVGSYSQNITLTYADDSVLSGANSNLATQAISLTGTVLDHSAPSLSTSSVAFGSVLVGYSASPVNVDLQNASGANRANLVLTAVNGTGNTSTLTRSGSASGSIVAGGSLSNSIGLVTTTAGLYTANYAYDVEDQNLPGGLDRTTQNLAVSGTVLNHSNGSFNSVSVDNNTLNLNLGTVITGAATQSAGFTIGNLSGSNVAGLSRGTVTPSGPNTPLLTSDLTSVNFANLAAGSTQSYNASMTTGTVGSLSASYSAAVSDQTLPGATANSNPLVLNLTGTVLDHSAPSLSTSSVSFGSVLVGYAASSVNVDLQNASGANRAALVLTAIHGTGNMTTLTRSGSASGSVVAGGSLSNSIGLVTSAAGTYAANYAYDVEDQNLPGGLDRTTQNLSVSGNVYAGASITANTATTLYTASSVLISNAAAAPLRATAYVDSYTISSGWTLNNLSIGSSIAPGSGTPTANVTFNAAGLLNGQTISGALNIILENDVAIQGAGNQDLGNLNWTLSHTVTGNSGTSTAEVNHGGSYAGLNGASDQTLGTEASLLAGTNTSGSPSTVTMTWRERTAGEAGGFAPSLPSGSVGLTGDVVTVTGTDNTIFVMEMTVDVPQDPQADVYLAWLDGGLWKLATEGNYGVNTTNPLYLNYQGTWLASGAGLTLGAYGYDGSKVWAVLDHNSEFAPLEFELEEDVEMVPEPSTLLLLAIGGVFLLLTARRRLKR
ncbi:MAG: choice-of-anchor D domain-containing protein [Planctomycetes bacterium]|nr:choice-of-anchor D domain-containing protein [Planctomycetota bacterium]